MDSMRHELMEYKIITTQEELEEFLDYVYGFHDALIREVAVVARGYVDHEGAMWGDVEPSDARIIFHSQFERCRVFELVLNEVQALRLSPLFALEAEGEVRSDGIVIYQSGVECKTDSILSAKVLAYRILEPEASGNRLNIVSHIPVFDVSRPCGQ